MCHSDHQFHERFQRGLQAALVLLMLLAVTAHADDCPRDPINLWAGKHLHGANIFQGRNPEGGPNGIGDGEFLQSDFDDLSQAGANYVQISHAGIFAETFPYALDTVVETSLDLTIQRAKSAGLYVVIAFRSGPGRNENAISNRSGPLREEIWTSSAARAAWAEMLKHTAERYRNEGAVVGYSIMVEPNAYARRGFPSAHDFYTQYGGTLEDVNGLYSLTTAAIRSVDEVTPILLEPDGYGGIDWVPFLDITGDSRTVYTAHDYTPFEYTHELSGNASYPGNYDVDSDGVSEEVDKTFLANVLAPLARFSRDHAVPVALTEFGVHRTATNASTYLRDRIDIQNAIGGWAVWTWQPARFIDPFNVHEPSTVLTTLREAWSRNCSPQFNRVTTSAGTVRGRVFSFTRRAIAKITVRLGTQRTMSDTNGNFSLAVAAGRYTLSARKRGFRCRVGSRRGAVRARIAVAPAAQLEIDIFCRRERGRS